MAGISLRRRRTEGAYVARAVAELRSWPALAVNDTRRGVAFAVRGTEILRPTSGDEVLLRLTAPAIGRLGPPLRACDQVATCADAAWVIVHVETGPDVDLLLALTSVAIQAHNS
ncbi:luciferase family protein [Nonomuraea sp. NPDC050556]|uniref:luciferase family protein n=1 Tax=Nonomuraea sp. NPDC050556 TaxID=3364369 RepID=UPI0037B36A3B